MLSEYRELLIGCGHDRNKKIEPRLCIKGMQVPPAEHYQWHELETIDYERSCNPGILWDLNQVPWSCPTSDDGCLYEMLPDAWYDEIHAYEVLEHLGKQGDFRAFFEVFSEIWRLLKPNGLFVGTVPSRYSEWAWGDPGHTRMIPPCMLVFLNREAYQDQQGKTTMTDYRKHYFGDFRTLHSSDDHKTHIFVLQAIKPARDGV
jgi:SAM-dependent methyltransferase